MRLLIWVVGFAVGIVAASILLLVNPWAFFERLPPLAVGAAAPLPYRWDQYRGLEAGIADLLGVDTRQRKAARIAQALPNARIGIIQFPASRDSPAALAVRISVISQQNSLWRAQLGTLDYWNIFWPGEGSIFAAGYSNFWPITRDALWASVQGGGRGMLGTEYAVSAPPPAGHAVGVTGGAGRHAGFTGEIRESLYPAENGPDWTLAIKANPPPPNP